MSANVPIQSSVFPIGVARNFGGQSCFTEERGEQAVGDSLIIYNVNQSVGLAEKDCSAVSHLVGESTKLVAGFCAFPNETDRRRASMNEVVFMMVDFPLSLSKRRGDRDSLC